MDNGRINHRRTALTIYKVIVAAPMSKPSATETRLIEAKLGAAGIKIEKAGE